jgi:hypothetical protein
VAQTQEDKKIAQINKAREAGLISAAEAKRLRQQVRGNSNGRGNVSNDVGRAVNEATAPKPSGTPASGGPRPTGPGTGDGDGGGRPGGPPTGPIGQPPGPAPDGQEWVWDGDQWVLQGDPVEPEETLTNAPRPGGSPGEGLYWSPIVNADNIITGWEALPIPGYVAEEDRDGFSKQDKEGAKKRLTDLLTQYGLADLIPEIDDLIRTWGGKNDTIIMSYLRGSDIYKERFKGNEARIKNGYAALNEAEYIGTESEIRKKMRDFGLDPDFYTNERLSTLIGGDVSANEVTDRLTKAKKIVDNADGNIKNSLVSLYGASLGDLIGYVLDPALAQEGLQRKVNAGIAYGVAKGYGLDMDLSLSEQVGDLTYGDERTARQQLGQASIMADSVRRLRNIESDIDLTDADVVEQQFGLDEESGRKVKKLQSRERARFTGSSGAFAGTLNNSSGY